MVRPKGVTLVAILTFLSSGALFFFYMLMYAGFSVGMESNPPMTGVSLEILWFLFIPLGLSGFALVLSFEMFTGAKIAWYGSMVFWIVLLIYFGWYAWFVGSNLKFAQSYEYQIAAALTVPLIYSVTSLAYFRTNGVRKYFRV